MYKGKYADKLLDGRWKVIGMPSGGTYELENIYNHTTILVTNRQLANIVNGEITVSQIISKRIGGIGRIPIDNHIVNTYHAQKKKYASERDNKQHD